MDLPPGTRTAVLVEGTSDKTAVEVLAGRRGRDLSAESVTVVSLGGATNIGSFLTLFRGFGLRYAGLYDVREERFFARGLERAGLGADLDRARMRALGFFACEPDLEAEFIRALGVKGVEAVVRSLGDLPALRTFQNQPFQRERSPDDQLHRFIGTMAGRKAKYAAALAAAVEVPPAPLADLLDWL